MEIGTAYRLFVNGQDLGGRGTVAAARADGKPATIPGLYIFNPGHDTVEVILHASNYHYRMGGIWHSPIIGSADALSRQQVNEHLMESIFIGCLFIMGLYHLFMFIYNRRDLATLSFAGCCINTSLRQMVIGHKLILSVLPAIPWEVYHRIEYFTIGALVPLVALYLQALFPKHFSRRYLLVCAALFGAFMLVVLATGSRIYTYVITPYQVHVLLFTVYCFIAVLREKLDGNWDAPYVLWPGIILLITAVNDVLYDKKLIDTMNLVPLGMIVLLSAQSALIAHRFAGALYVANRLSRDLWENNTLLAETNKELTQLKEKLEEKVRERTSELETALEGARSAARAKNAFLANMNHELRTPLNAIIGFSQILEHQLEKVLSNEQIESVQLIREGGQQLLSIVNDILDLARIEAGKINLVITDLDLVEIIKNTAQFIQALAQQKNISIEMDLPDNPVFIRADEIRLKEIITNLMANAIKFTEPQKKIGLAVHQNETNASTTVWDEGEGIAEKDCQRIFEPFEQVVTTKENKPNGAGLGLSIVKKLVLLQDGTITVESMVGRGSRFTIMLPLSAARPEDIKKPVKEAPADMPSLAGSEVLFVEDNELNRKLLRSFAGMMGINADYAATGTEALSKARARRFQLIFMDIQLPEMDGPTACREIKRILGDCAPPIIALTAYSAEGDKEIFLRQGFDDYLSKPFSIDELRAVIAAHIKGKG